MKFKLKALYEKEFAPLFTLNDLELEKIGAIRMTVDAFPGFPCRVSYEDAEIGEEVILLEYQHHKASGPIFIRKIARTPTLVINEIPKMINHRLLSIRGYNNKGIMKAASVTEGKNLKEHLTKTFENEAIQYIHIHNASPGCYNCVVERA